MAARTSERPRTRQGKRHPDGPEAPDRVPRLIVVDFAIGKRFELPQKRRDALGRFVRMTQFRPMLAIERERKAQESSFGLCPS